MYDRCTVWGLLVIVTIFERLKHLQIYERSIVPVKQIKMCKIVIIFLSISLNMCFGCSKEPSHGDGSFEYPQHMFRLRNKKNNFQLRTLIWRPEDPLHVLIDASSPRTYKSKNNYWYMYKNLNYLIVGYYRKIEHVHLTI